MAAADIGKTILGFVKMMKTDVPVYCVMDGFSPATKYLEAAIRYQRRSKHLPVLENFFKSGIQKSVMPAAVAAAAKNSARFADVADELAAFLRSSGSPIVWGTSVEPEEADSKVALMMACKRTLVVASDGDFAFRPCHKGTLAHYCLDH